MNVEKVKMELSKLPKFERIEWNFDETTIGLMRALDKYEESFAQDFKERWRNRKMENIINSCGWCGVELPPYAKWKFCLCPKCELEN